MPVGKVVLLHEVPMRQLVARASWASFAASKSLVGLLTAQSPTIPAFPTKSQFRMDGDERYERKRGRAKPGLDRSEVTQSRSHSSERFARTLAL